MNEKYGMTHPKKTLRKGKSTQIYLLLYILLTPIYNWSDSNNPFGTIADVYFLILDKTLVPRALKEGQDREHRFPLQAKKRLKIAQNAIIGTSNIFDYTSIFPGCQRAKKNFDNYFSACVRLNYPKSSFRALL